MFSSNFIIEIKKINSTPWNIIHSISFCGASLFAAVIIRFANRADHWVPILDNANLLFHEAGHFFLGLFSYRLEVYGGTLGQLVFPVISAFEFWRKRNAVATFISLIWLCENLWNISHYMADATIQILPLIGNGDRLHDWAEILNRWSVLNRDTIYAQRLSVFAGFFVAIIWIWLFLKWLESSKNKS